MIQFVRIARGLGLAAAVALPACSGSGSGGGGKTASASSFASGLPADKSFASVSDADVTTLCDAWARYVIGPQRDTFCRNRAWEAATAKVSQVDSMGCFSQGPCPGWAIEPSPGDMRCTAQCSDATGPVCSYECTGSTAADLDKNCAEAKAAACAGTDADLQKACDDAEGKCNGPIAVADVTPFCSFQKPASTCTATVGEFEACVDEYFAVVEESLSGFSSCSDLTVADLIERGAGPATPVVGKHTACTTFTDKCPGAFAPESP